MLKKINRFLKLFGFNLVHAKRPRTSLGSDSQSRRGTAFDHVAVGCAARAQSAQPNNTGIGQIQQPNSDNNITGPTS